MSLSLCPHALALKGKERPQASPRHETCTAITAAVLHFVPLTESTHLNMDALVEDTWSHSMPLLVSLTTATRQNLPVCTDLSTIAVPVVMGTSLLRAVL